MKRHGSSTAMPPPGTKRTASVTMTLSFGTSRLIMFALLTAGCAPAAGPADGDGDGDGDVTTKGMTTATSGTTDNTSTDLDNDGIPDHLDDFIDLDGDG